MPNDTRLRSLAGLQVGGRAAPLQRLANMQHHRCDDLRFMGASPAQIDDVLAIARHHARTTVMSLDDALGLIAREAHVQGIDNALSLARTLAP